MTTQELSLAPEAEQHEEEQRRRRLILVIIAALVVIGLIAALAFWGLGRNARGDYWTEIDARQPITADREALMTRLDQHGSWDAELYTGREIEQEDWSTDLTIDVPGYARDRVVISNLDDKQSVADNGRLVILGPAYRPLVERILLDNPEVFVNGDAEDERETYRLGGWLAYYSPAGAESDRTKAVEAYLAEIAHCPYDADPCPGATS